MKIALLAVLLTITTIFVVGLCALIFTGFVLLLLEPFFRRNNERNLKNGIIFDEEETKEKK